MHLCLLQAKQEELISMAGEVNAAKEEAGQLRKQLSAMGVQLEAATAQISQQQAAIAKLDETTMQLQVGNGASGWRRLVRICSIWQHC